MTSRGLRPQRLDRLRSRIARVLLDPTVFSERGIVPIGYAAFAFALGVTAGLLIRRTVPAMAVTLAVFAAVVSGFALRVRFHLLPPLHLTSALNMSWVTATGTGGPAGPGSLYVGITPNLPGAWISSGQVTTAAGSTSLGPPPSDCGANSTYSACTAAIARLHLRQVVVYQPAQPVLGVAVVRDRDLPRARARTGRVLRLVGPPPRLVTARYATPRGRAGCPPG